MTRYDENGVLIPPPIPGEPPAGWRWKLSHRDVPEVEYHVVTAAEVRLAIIYGGRMKAAGQVIAVRTGRPEAYWALIREKP